jgi:ribose transport system permease protein
MQHDLTQTATANEQGAGAQPPDAPSAPPRVTVLGAFKRLTAKPLFAVVTGCIGLLVFFSIQDGTTFASVDNFRNILLAASITLILSVGITYVIITAGFDLSIGSVLVFSGIVSMKAMIALGGDGWATASAGLVVALAAGAAWGLINGSLIGYVRLNPIIVTLGTLGAALGLGQVLTNGQDLVEVPTSMTSFGGERLFGIPSLSLVALAVTAVAGVALAKTKFGRYTYAVGSNREAAQRAGLPVRRQLLSVYVLSGTMAGLASWLSLALFSSTNIGGNSLDNLEAATAVLLGGASLYGGVGIMLGTLFGAFIPVILANGLVIANVQSFWQQVATGGVLILAVYLDRERRERRE